MNSQAIRAQYHFRRSPQGLLAWDVRRLVELSKHFTHEQVALSDMRELDESYWYDHEDQPPTCRSITDHMALVEAADLQYPIILCAEGRVMDGMHRVCKALLLGETHISGVRFTETPKPDHIGRQPDELPYD